jgi:hypothetical protein
MAAQHQQRQQQTHQAAKRTTEHASAWLCSNLLHCMPAAAAAVVQSASSFISISGIHPDVSVSAPSTYSSGSGRHCFWHQQHCTAAQAHAVGCSACVFAGMVPLMHRQVKGTACIGPPGVCMYGLIGMSPHGHVGSRCGFVSACDMRGKNTGKAHRPSSVSETSMMLALSHVHVGGGGSVLVCLLAASCWQLGC